jgi:hypothetical protein
MPMTRYFAVSLAALAATASFHSSIRPLSPHLRAEIKRAGEWHKGCPVALSGLRLLTVSRRDFDGQPRTGRLVVRASAAEPLSRVFHKLYRQHFRIRHMAISDTYGPLSGRPADGDVTASFECRQAVPSPCVGGSGTGSWSEHAYGEAVDVNPVENPYVGCGQSNDPSSRPFFNRSHHRKGMVTAKVIGAFRSIGWGWGGSWSGSTKDYMHFSASGH